MRFTNVSDGTGEAGVVKVNAASAHSILVQGNVIYPATHLKVREIEYDTKGMGLRLQWDATTPVDMLVLGGFGTMKFDRFGGLPNPLAAGATGNILFTTIGAAANATYSVVLRMTKGVPNATF